MARKKLLENVLPIVCVEPLDGFLNPEELHEEGEGRLGPRLAF